MHVFLQLRVGNKFRQADRFMPFCFVNNLNKHKLVLINKTKHKNIISQ